MRPALQKCRLLKAMYAVLKSVFSATLDLLGEDEALSTFIKYAFYYQQDSNILHIILHIK
jgi:hypothetical protein